MRLPRRTAHFSGWVHEVKFDGWRLQVHKHGQDVWLYSGNGRARRTPSGYWNSRAWLMCGRITQKSPPDQLRLTILMGTPDDPRVTKAKPRYNGAPSQDLLVIRRHPKTGEYLQDLLRWGLIPNWTKEISPKLKPINATAEGVATAPMFRDAYARRRCIVPVDNFFEWKAVKGAKAKQPYAIALKSGKPFGIAGIWESWKHPESGEVIRTFCIITTAANELVLDIHDRMPVILPSETTAGWRASSPIPETC